MNNANVLHARSAWRANYCYFQGFAPYYPAVSKKTPSDAGRGALPNRMLLELPPGGDFHSPVPAPFGDARSAIGDRLDFPFRRLSARLN